MKKPVLTSNPLNSAIDIDVDAIAGPHVKRLNVTGLAIGILKDGQKHTYGYGQIKRGTGILPDADSLFEIGSITKTFTAALLAKFVGEGIIGLNDPVTRFLPNDVAANTHLQKIEILHLINHTSGLPRLPGNLFFYSNPYLNPYKNYHNKQLLAALKRCRLNSAPGEVYAYSNFGVGVLGYILEKVSGKRYEQLIKEIITVPLKMENTGQHLTGEQLTRFVTGYNKWGIQTPHWDFGALAACGALRSTINDMLLYALANISPAHDGLSNAFRLTHQLTFNKFKIAMAWHTLIYKEDHYLWHNGGTGGGRSFIVFNPEKAFAIVVLSNSAVSCDALAIKILRKLQ